MKISEILRESTQQGKTAVVGWGRGMGHKGHMYLASAVIEYAERIGATPYFFVSETVGSDDPLTPEEKLDIYRTVFPKQANIFHSGKNPIDVVESVHGQGFTNLVFVVGEDQKNSFQFLAKRGAKSGDWNTSFGPNVTVMSRQETKTSTSNLDGPRATPMREILARQDVSAKEKFAVWRDAMPDALSDMQVFELMHKASESLGFQLNETDQPQSGTSPIPGTPSSIRHEIDDTAERDRRTTIKAKKLQRWMRHT